MQLRPLLAATVVDPELAERPTTKRPALNASAVDHQSNLILLDIGVVMSQKCILLDSLQDKLVDDDC